MATARINSDIPKEVYEKMLKAMQEQLLFSAFPGVYEQNGVLHFMDQEERHTYTDNATSIHNHQDEVWSTYTHGTHGTPPPKPFWATQDCNPDLPASQQIIDCVATDVEEPSKALVVRNGSK